MSENKSTDAAPLFVGIDVALDKLDLARSDSSQNFVFANDAQGADRIVQLLRPLAPAAIVVEAAGGLERDVLAALLCVSKKGIARKLFPRG